MVAVTETTAGTPAEMGMAGPGRPRGRRPLELTVASLLVLTGVIVTVRATGPSDATATTPIERAHHGVRITTLAPHSSPLRDGDVVVALGDQRLGAAALPRAYLNRHIEYHVLRHGRPQTVEVTLGRYPLRAALARNWATLVVLVSILAVAGYVFKRQPDDPAARVLLVMVALSVCGDTARVVSLQVIDLSGGPGWWAGMASGIAYSLLWASMVHFIVIFATRPAFLARRPGLVAILYALPAGLCATSLASAFGTGSPRLGTLASAMTISELAATVALVAGVVTAYRRIDTAERRRLRTIMAWIAVSALLDLGLWSLPLLVLGHPMLADRFHPLVFVPCPPAFAVAVLRRRLFDIDVVVRRSLVFATLGACVVAMYVLVVVAISLLFPVKTSNRWVNWVATGVVAVACLPLQQRLWRVISRLVYGYRDDPFLIIAQFGRQLEELPSPEDVLPLVVETLATTLRLSFAAVELIYPDGTVEEARYGQLQGTPLDLPLVFRGESLGRLLVGQRTGDTFSRAETRLLGELASQAGVAAHAVRMTRDLQRSREHIVTRVEEERRRLRRDLHDGVAPTMAAAALELQAIRRLAVSDPDKARGLADRVAESLQSALADIGHLVDHLRPAALDQLGLVSALRQRALSLATPGGPATFEVTVDARGDFTDIPAAMEVAAFHIAGEALHNASRHANASSCAVRLTLDEGGLDVEIDDNGSGLPANYHPGVGLASMRERAAELGGTWTIENKRTGGTIVRTHLPHQPRPLTA